MRPATDPGVKRLKLSSDAPLLTPTTPEAHTRLAALAAASTVAPATPLPSLPSLHQWLAPFCGGVKLMAAHPDPTVAVALWHVATQRLVSCSPNFSTFVDRSLPQLQRGYSWPSLFASNDLHTPLPSAVTQSRALLAQALSRLGRGDAHGGMAVLATSLRRCEQTRWLFVDFAPARQTGGAATVLTFVREVLPAWEPWLQLREDGDHDEHDRQLVAAPTKRRNGIVHPWDAQVKHFKFMTT